MASKIAIITGGSKLSNDYYQANTNTNPANGIGLEVAKALLAGESSWQIYVLGSNETRGTNAAKQHLPGSKFLRADVRNYSDLASAFHTVYKTEGRLDFVFANAGVLESCDILAPLATPKGDVDISPPRPNLAVFDVNLVGGVYTCYLAMHYFSLSRQGGFEERMNLIITGSCLSFYPSALPLYTASKHALIGFMRSIALPLHKHNVHVNMICPGMVQTDLGGGELFKGIAPKLFVQTEQIVQLTQLILDGKDVVDSKGVQVSGADLWNRAVEVSGGNKFYFREGPEISDQIMERMMTETFLRIK